MRSIRWRNTAAAHSVADMTERYDDGTSELGGRLPLVATDALDETQRALYDRLHLTRLRSADGAGYTAVLPDGRLIGPFNAMLHNPRIADPLLEWVQAIGRAGMPETAIAALRHGDVPAGLRPEACLAHRITAALVRDHQAPDDLYRQAVTVFGTDGLVALVNLIGQYLNTCALLACFQVPAPAPHPTTASAA
jgi:4-carboxymuconolactone decarboxylase